MNVTIPVNASESLSRPDFERFKRMMQQGRPLVLENGRTVRVASLWECCTRSDHKKITELFTEAMESQWGENSRTNRDNLTMQAAGLWRDYTKKKGNDERFDKAFRFMQIGLDPEKLDVSEEEAMGFCQWVNQHHQQHAMSLRGFKITAIDGKIQLPIKFGKHASQGYWRKQAELIGEDELFEPHPDPKIGKWKGCFLGKDGYEKGHSWSYPPHSQVQRPTQLFAYEERPDAQQDLLVLCNWTTGMVTSANGHTAAEIVNAETKEAISFGLYRFDDWAYRKACCLNQAYLQVPDLSHWLWNAPAYLYSYRFACSPQQRALYQERAETLLDKTDIPYQAPTQLCQQPWEVMLERKLDFTRNLWKHLGLMAYAEGGHRLLSFLPDPVRSAGSWLCNGIAKSVEQWTPEIVLHIAAAVSTPFENLVALLVGGSKVSEEMEHEKPLVDSLWTFLTQRRRMTHPTVVPEVLEKYFRDYEDKVREDAARPPVGTKTEWLATDLFDRVYPVELLDEIPERQHA